MAPGARGWSGEVFKQTEGTEWPTDARLTAAVRCPRSSPQQQPGNVPDETGQWIEVLAKR
jgi:hypothetical protein